MTFINCPICGAGIPLVPSRLIGPDNECSLIGHIDDCHDGQELMPVLKTAYAACPCGKRFRDSEDGVEKLEAHLRTCDIRRHFMLATLKKL